MMDERTRLDGYRQDPRPHPSYGALVGNHDQRRRYVVVFRNGAHLIGVPTASTAVDPAAPDAKFVVVTSQARYHLPFDLLAFLEPLADQPGQRPGDGIALPPEPCEGPERRQRSGKFGILDAPGLLQSDLEAGNAVPSGLALLYLDVDHFKAVNEHWTERRVDETVLPELQRIVERFTSGHGHAYAEGGDEMIVLLRNMSRHVAIAFAEELRKRTKNHPFEIDGNGVRLTLSIGLATCQDPSKLAEVPGWANAAKREAKRRGRDRTVVTGDGEAFLPAAAEPWYVKLLRPLARSK